MKKIGVFFKRHKIFSSIFLVIFLVIFVLISFLFINDYISGIPRLKYKIKLNTDGSDSGEVVVVHFTSGRNVELLEIPEEVKIEGRSYRVVEIGKNAFGRHVYRGWLPNVSRSLRYKKIEEIKLPNSIEKISGKAFEEANIRKINIPASVKEIAGRCFNFSKIEEIVFEDGRVEIDCVEMLMHSEMKSVVLPDDLISIGESTFGSCYLLENIILPPNLEILMNGAFSECAIVTVNIPSKVKSIGNIALGDLLENITFEGDTPPEIDAEYIIGSAATVYIPSGCKEIYEEKLAVHFPSAEFIETEKD